MYRCVIAQVCEQSKLHTEKKLTKFCLPMRRILICIIDGAIAANSMIVSFSIIVRFSLDIFQESKVYRDEQVPDPVLFKRISEFDASCAALPRTIAAEAPGASLALGMFEFRTL